MSFGRPLALVALVVVPALVLLWRAEERRRVTRATAFSSAALIPNLIARRPGARRYVPLGLFALALVALIVGAARPHAKVSVPRKEATIVLAIDVSRSMTAQDVRPTRLQAARDAADAFLAKVPKDYSISVIGFGTRAFVAVPPTTDRVLAHDALLSLAPSEGTAIGDAVALAVKLGSRQRTTDGAVPPTSVLLISDGARDGGQTSPLASARRAAAAHIPISTVLVGTANGIVTNKLLGGYVEQIRVPPSPGTLEHISQLSGGKFYRARTDVALKQVYEKLATRIGHRTQSRQITDVFAFGAGVLLLAGGALSAFWFRRLVP
ncbi:MAG: Ca-activated chloride channel [Gaiellaceae bacterium]|nr:Ca-activated chloride channel [Gaiellaceae bacterium]